MSPEHESVSSLREALKISPNNLPLRELLAQTLLGLGRHEEAEQEFRSALGLSPDHVKLKLGLARAFAQQGKDSQALVVLESIAGAQNLPPSGHLLLAKLLLKAGNQNTAARHYEKATAADVSLADPQLAQQFSASAPAPQRQALREPISQTGDEELPAVDQDVERPKVTFQDVGGMDVVKEQIRMKIIHPLTHPELYAAYGKKVGGGILMYGPPGCGKTHLARATAGEIKASFLSVGINDVLDMWIGNSEKNLHELFEQARRSKPCVLFFDEVDALAASRADMRHTAGRHLINQFLAEMDGISANNDGLLILAATNAPWHVDSAFRRPGRFDRIIFVPPPDQPARAAILRILLRGKPVKDVDYDQLAKKTDYFSGADLKALVDAAVEDKLNQAMKTGSGVPPLITKDLIAATTTVKPSTRDWFASARNYAMYSNQGGIYDDILKFLKQSS